MGCRSGTLFAKSPDRRRFETVKRVNDIDQVRTLSLIFRILAQSRGSLFRESVSIYLLMDGFDDRGNALPYADAHGCQAVATAALFHFVNERGHDPGAAATEGMTEGNGSAVDV